MKEIFATLGPSSFKSDVIRAMEAAGVTMFRINLSHEPFEALEERIAFIRAHAETPICLDSEGAQMRTGAMDNGGVLLTQGEQVAVHFEQGAGNSSSIPLTPRAAQRELRVGDVLDIGFGTAEVRLENVCESGGFKALVTRGGLVESRKAVGVNHPVDLPSITEKDEQSFALGLRLGLTNFALSFAKNGEEVRRTRALLGPGVKLISKVESMSALLHLKDVIDASDELLIDRGDLSKETSLEVIPFLQRRIISLARLWGKPVHVATNLLESMTLECQPTRAELNDIVSTILMGADGLVLAAETAVGKYPVEAVQIVRAMIDLCRKWTGNTSIDEILDMSCAPNPHYG